MTEREKVIKGLEYCIDYAQRVKDSMHDVPCKGCSYVALKPIKPGQGDCIDMLFKDALAMLKDQEKQSDHKHETNYEDWSGTQGNDIDRITEQARKSEWGIFG